MIQWAVNLAQQYPELLAIGLGQVIPILFTWGLYNIWYSPTWTQRECFQITSVLDFLICYGFTSNLWHYLDHDHDAHGFIVVSSLGAACCVVAIHLLLLRWAMHRWPWIESKPTGNPPPPVL